MRERGKDRHKRDIEAAEPVCGDVTINHEQSAQYKRTSKVASFQQSGSADAQPLPPLQDVELSWMGPNGFVLTDIEFIGDIAYARSWWCPVAACLGARSVILFHAGMKSPAEAGPYSCAYGLITLVRGVTLGSLHIHAQLPLQIGCNSTSIWRTASSPSARFTTNPSARVFGTI